jgi:transcriptional regulator with XRE-family HTH domain
MNRNAVARNLTRLVERSHLSRRELAKSVEMSDKTLWRWMQDGVDRTNGKNGEKLERLCRKLGVPVAALSATRLTEADICAEKAKEMVQVWEQQGIEFDWIHNKHCAVIAVHRLKEERPEMWQQARRMMNWQSDKKAWSELEEWATKLAMQSKSDVETVFRQLLEWAAFIEAK